MKFTNKGHMHLNLITLEVDTDKASFLISVSDTGIGVPKDKQKMIFEKFTQVDQSMTRSYPGTGLGLAICSHVSSLMDAIINLESIENKGSTFSLKLTLPLSKQRAHHQEHTPAKKTTEGFDSLNPQILVVEDNIINQKVLVSILERLGCLVDLVEDGQAALEQLEEKTYDLVFMDLQMPTMVGIEATQHIRWQEKETGQHQLIVAMTAHAMREDREKYLAAGKDDLISKPLQIEPLKERLTLHLSSKNHS